LIRSHIQGTNKRKGEVYLGTPNRSVYDEPYEFIGNFLLQRRV
jgi:hypothetical protein